MKFETKFQEIIQRTHDVVSFRFPRPAELAYKPGQFFFVTIKQGDKELKNIAKLLFIIAQNLPVVLQSAHLSTNLFLSVQGQP